MRSVISFLRLLLVTSSASFGIAACADDGGGGTVTAEQLAALCTQLATKTAECAEETNVDCNKDTPACQSQTANYIQCLISTQQDICGFALLGACQTQLGALGQCQQAYCKAHPTDSVCTPDDSNP